MTTPSRQNTLTNQILSLERRLIALHQAEQRFAWYRLSAFLIGALLTWVAFSYLSLPAGWVTLALAFLGFFTVVWFHRRLDRWIEVLQTWKELKSRQLARLTLDWAALPEPPTLREAERSPLDIDLDLTGPRSLHHLLDNSISLGGSQRLADWLTSGVPELEALSQRQQLVKELAPMRRFRDRLQLTYHLAAKERLQGDELLAWLQADYPAERVRRALPVAILLAGLNLALLLLDLLGVLPSYWPLSIAITLAYYYLNAGALIPFLEAVVELDNQLSSFKPLLAYLECYPLKADSHLAQLCACCRSSGELPSQQLRRIKGLTAAVGMRMNPIMGLLLNAFLPWDFTTAFLVARQRMSLGVVLPAWLDTLEQLEALCALAEFADLHPGHAYPQIEPVSEKALCTTDLGHPLLPPNQVVCNDFSVANIGEIAVITGSNMAGKSTFLKTVGVNLCLAYAGAPVLASDFKARPFRLHTCIRISDSIADGFSYFYAEVRCLKRLLERLDTTGMEYPLLYLVDEIFRGTNNRERLLGSRAYLQALVNKTGIGLLATHDLELAALAKQAPQIHNFHFRDHVQDGRLVFDYKIRPGPSPTTNALIIMRLEGLPVED